MDGKNLGMLFAERGFVIKNPTAFTKEADSVDISELVDRLTNLEKKINSSANIVDFSKELLTGLDKIEEIVNLDDYSRLSDKAKLDGFNASLKTMRGYFAKVQSFIKAEERMKFQKNNMYDVMRRIYDLDKREMSDVERTSETLRLYKGKKDCEKEYNKSYQEYLTQRQAYNDSVRGFSLVDFKNELLKAINNIQDNCKDLALSPESKEQLQVTISDIRDKTARYGLESIRSKTEFDSLCKRFGIASTGTPKKVVEEERRTTPIPETPSSKKTEPSEVPSPNKDYTGPVPKGQELAEIHESKEVSIAKFLEELKTLNPDAEFELVKDAEESKFDAHIKSSVPAQDLHLPTSFYYTNEGISNKFSDAKNPLNIKVSELERKLDSPEPPKPEPKPVGLFDKAKDFISNLTKKGSIDPDKKYEVIRSRKAIIGSYGKSLLTFSALSAVGLGIAGAPLVPAALIGAGFGAIAQTIYRKVVKGTDVHIEAFENTDYEKEPENAPVIVAGWHKASEKLMDVFKRRKLGEYEKEEQEELLDDQERGTGR